VFIVSFVQSILLLGFYMVLFHSIPLLRRIKISNKAIVSAASVQCSDGFDVVVIYSIFF